MLNRSASSLIFLGVILFTLANLCIKYTGHIPFLELILFRGLISLVMSIYSIKKRHLSLLGNHKPFLIARGLFGVGGLSAFYYTLHNMPFASAVTIHSMAPIFIVLVAGFMLKEKASKLQWIFLLFAATGVAITKGFDPRITTLAASVSILGCVCTGFALNFARKLKDFDDPVVVVFYFSLIVVPLVGPYCAFNWVQPQGIDWLMILTAGVLTQWAQLAITKAFFLKPASETIHITYLGPVFAFVLGYLLFGETMGLIPMLGLALVLTSVILSSFTTRRRRAREKMSGEKSQNSDSRSGYRRAVGT